MGEKITELYRTSDELFSNPKPREEESFKLIPFCETPAGRQAAAWSGLGNLIVGEEYKGSQTFP